jgi:hypothetical protein
VQERTESQPRWGLQSDFVSQPRVESIFKLRSDQKRRESRSNMELQQTLPV